MKENKLKVLLVSPFSAKRTGGIGTWSKIVLDYGEKDSRTDLLYLNTATRLPKRWAVGNRITHLLIGGIDTFRILVCLFYKMLVVQPQVVHYTSSAASALRKDLLAVWIVKKMFKKKIVLHWHFGRIPSIFQERGKEYKLFYKVCKKADVSIPIDENSYKVLRNEQINSVFVPNPIPVALQKEAEQLNIQKIQLTRIKGDVLFVGHMLKTKGIFELVEACANCNTVHNLIMVGPFFDEQVIGELTSLAQKRDNGQWLKLVGEKKREEVWEYYQKCSVFCLPSYSEGFPYVILEAMAFGCPIVATKVGAIPGMLEEECGELIEAKQIVPLVQSLTKTIEEPALSAKMGLNAHEKVLKQYTIEKVYEKYYEAWKSLI